MCELTPKISCSTTTAPAGAPCGLATYAGKVKPSAAFRSTNEPMSFSLSVDGLKFALEEVQAILAPEDLARNHVRRRAKDAAIDRGPGVGLIPLLHDWLAGLRQALLRESALLQQLRKHFLAARVALLGPGA